MAAAPGRPGTLPRRAVKLVLDGDEPVRFRWQGCWRTVLQAQEVWVDAGNWWDGDVPTRFYRVATADGGVYELAREERAAASAWMYRVYD